MAAVDPYNNPQQWVNQARQRAHDRKYELPVMGGVAAAGQMDLSQDQQDQVNNILNQYEGEQLNEEFFDWLYDQAGEGPEPQPPEPPVTGDEPEAEIGHNVNLSLYNERTPSDGWQYNKNMIWSAADTYKNDEVPDYAVELSGENPEDALEDIDAIEVEVLYGDNMFEDQDGEDVADYERKVQTLDVDDIDWELADNGRDLRIVNPVDLEEILRYEGEDATDMRPFFGKYSDTGVDDWPDVYHFRAQAVNEDGDLLGNNQGEALQTDMAEEYGPDPYDDADLVMDMHDTYQAIRNDDTLMTGWRGLFGEKKQDFREETMEDAFSALAPWGSSDDEDNENDANAQWRPWARNMARNRSPIYRNAARN